MSDHAQRRLHTIVDLRVLDAERRRCVEVEGAVLMPGWLVIAIIVWLVLVVAILALLNAAKRADAAADADRAWLTAAKRAEPRTTASVSSPWTSPPMLDRLAQEVRQELDVDQVMIVVCDERVPRCAVAVAGAGMAAGVLGSTLGPRDSIAAAVALSGHAVIAPDHGPLVRPALGAGGDAAAVPLSTPAGAIAVARLERSHPMTADDLQSLHAMLQRHGLADTETQQSSSREQRASVGRRDRFPRQATAVDDGTSQSGAAERPRPVGRSSRSSGA